MKYTLLATRTFDRSLKRVSAGARQYIENIVFDLELNSRSGESLRQELKGLRSLHAKHKNTHYRVIYSIEEKSKTIILHYTGSRENIYKRVKRLKLKLS